MPIPEFVQQLGSKVGHDRLWLPGMTAVVRRGDEVLMVRRSDDLRWTPVTGVVDPLESPAETAVREAWEETGVHIRVDRLAGVFMVPEVTYPNGDVSAYVDTTFACTWLSGEPYPADDESVDVRWWPADDLPAMSPGMTERVQAALSDEVAARF